MTTSAAMAGSVSTRASGSEPALSAAGRRRSAAAWLLPASLIFAAAALLLMQAAALKYYGTFARGADAAMYYAQARSLAIDGDLDVSNEIQEWTPVPDVFRDAAGQWRLHRTAEGRIANKYTVGWAVLVLPAFVIGHVASAVLGWPATGYGAAYDLAVGGWVWLLTAAALIGLGVELARRFGPVPASVAVLGLALGSNLPYYVAVYPTMTHALSFAAAAWLLVMAFRLCDDPGSRRLWPAAAVAVFFLVLLRPTDVVLAAVLAPAAWRRLRSGQSSHVARALLPALLPLLALAALGVQLLAWRWSHGAWTFNAYGRQGEGFHWLTPALPDFLLSSNHGAWYFHPLLGVAAVGLGWACLKRGGESAWPVLAAAGLALGLHVYVHAAWHDWAFGHGFGHRMMVNSAALAAVGLAFAWARLPRWGRGPAAALLALLVVWNLLLGLTLIRGGIPPVGPVPPGQLSQAQWRTVEAIGEGIRR